jgi:antitoxin VapB
MVERLTAKLFEHRGGQAVRLPEEFRLPGTEVQVRRFGRGVLLEPVEFDVDSWLVALRRYGNLPFMDEGREQPPMPDDLPPDCPTGENTACGGTGDEESRSAEAPSPMSN